LNEKNLSTNSSWGFEHVLGTMNYYWLCPHENFSPQSSLSRWRCDHFSKKWPKSKSDTTFTHKKTSVTHIFCKRNFSRMNRFGVMNFLSSTAPSSVVWRNRRDKKVASIEIWKHIFIACFIDLWQHLCQKMKMDSYQFFSHNFIQFGIIWILSPKMQKNELRGVKELKISKNLRNMKILGKGEKRKKKKSNF